jgi:hypothetical protein
MTKCKSTKGQIPQRKLMIEQHEPHWVPGLIPCAPEE